jgi:hypothetical protein
MSEDLQSGQSATGGKNFPPHDLHLVEYISPSFSPSQNLFVLLMGISNSILVALDFIAGQVMNKRIHLLSIVT